MPLVSRCIPAGALALLLGAPSGAFGAESANLASTPTPTAWQVYQVLHATCAECHGGHLAKPKGKLGYILDLRRLVDEDYISPGIPESSDLFRALISTDEDEKMPPPDSDGPKLSDADIELIRGWIAAGAITSDAAAPAPGSVPPSPGDAVSPARPLGQTLGRMHPLMVHFPIALLLAACAAELLSRISSGHAGWLQGTTRGTLWLAAGGGVLAAVFGWLNAAHEGFASADVDIHRWLGVTTATLAVITLLASELAERARARDATRGSRGLLLVLLIVAAVIVTLAGHTGGILAYGEDYLGF